MPDRPAGQVVRLPFTGQVGDGRFLQAAPLNALQGATLRFRRPGDWICPLGAGGRKSLGDYMTDKKIPRPERDIIPLLCREDRVLWVIGWGADEAMRVDGTQKNVLLQYMIDQ